MVCEQIFGTVKSQTAKALARLRRHGQIVEFAPTARTTSKDREGAA
ncbi:hypothetical protein ABIA35_008200 [Catenulispora sp. MAP12-49]